MIRRREAGRIGPRGEVTYRLSLQAYFCSFYDNIEKSESGKISEDE